MSFLASAADLDCYLGGALRLATEDQGLADRLAAVGITLRLTCSNPSALVAVGLHAPVWVSVEPHAAENEQSWPVVDVELECEASFLDHYFRGERSLIGALSSGEVVARGRISKLLKALPVLQQVFPYYLRLVTAESQIPNPRSGVNRWLSTNPTVSSLSGPGMAG